MTSYLNKIFFNTRFAVTYKIRFMYYDHQLHKVINDHLTMCITQCESDSILNTTGKGEKI